MRRSTLESLPLQGPGIDFGLVVAVAEPTTHWPQGTTNKGAATMTPFTGRNLPSRFFVIFIEFYILKDRTKFIMKNEAAF